MKKWKLTIPIKKYLSDGTDFDAIVKASDGIIKEILVKKNSLIRMGMVEDEYDLEENVLGLIHNAGELARDEDPNALDEFEFALHDLYDWADAEHIWFK